MGELNDPFTATFYDAYAVDHCADGQVPLALVPTRQLRQRVRALNVETSFFSETGHLDADHASGPPTSSDDPSLAACIDPAPATIEPRRRGRQTPLFRFPLLPMMPDQKATLTKILKGHLVFPVETGLGRRHRCPGCTGTTADIDTCSLTLHVYPTSAGDLVFRCHRCGFCLDSVEFVRKTMRQKTLADAASLLMGWGCLSQPLPPEQLAGYQRLAELRTLIENGREHFATARSTDGRPPPLFGDWSLVSTASLRQIFTNLRLPAAMPASGLTRVSRDVFGRWSALHLHEPHGYLPRYRLELRDWEPPAACTWFLPRAADFLEGRELILCAESQVAKAIERAVRLWPTEDRLPVALIDQCVDSLHESVLPFSRVWAAVRGTRSARFALPLLTSTIIPGEPDVRIRRLSEDLRFQENGAEVLATRSSFCEVAIAPEALEDLAAMIAVEKDYQPLSLVLADVLGLPGVHTNTRRRLLESVSGKTGIAPSMLVDEGVNPWTGGPYALNATGGTTYVALEGRYWRRGRREKDFTPVTNFVVHLMNYQVDAKGKGTHHGCLELNGRKLDLSLSSAVIDRPKRLMTMLTEAASGAGAEYPVIDDSKAKRLLPDIIKATQRPLMSAFAPQTATVAREKR